MAGLSFLPDLGTGTTLANFQFFGNFPLASDKLNRVLRLGAIAFAYRERKALDNKKQMDNACDSRSKWSNMEEESGDK